MQSELNITAAGNIDVYEVFDFMKKCRKKIGDPQTSPSTDFNSELKYSTPTLLDNGPTPSLRLKFRLV